MTLFQKLESFINRYGIYIIFIFLYAWRPFNLGFYSDDWATIVGVNNTPNLKPFSFDLFNFYQNTFLNRPGQIPIFFFFSSIFQDNPILWQFLCAILMLISAIILKQLLIKISNLLSTKKELIPNIIACFWLSIPWMLGITAWIVCLPAILSSIFFFLSATFLFIGWQKTKIYFFYSTIFLLISCLLYEAFFFQYFIFFIFGIILKTKKTKWKSIIIPFLFLSISQSIAILWNRFAVTGSTPIKSFYSDWQIMFRNYLSSLPEILLKSAIEFRKPIILAVLIILLIFLITSLFGLSKKKYRTLTIKTLSLVVFSFIGYFIAIWIYCISGYGIFSLGPLSRTTLSLSLWLIIILFFIITYCSIVLPSVLKKIFYLITFCLLASMIFSTLLRTMDWSKAWQIQQTILSRAPINDLQKINENSVIVYITPNTVNEAFVFLAGYDLDNALYNKYPELKRNFTVCPHIPQGYGYFDSHIYWSIISWDGDNLFYNNGLYSKSSNVYIWDYYKKTFYQVKKPFILKNREFTPYNQTAKSQ